MILFSVLVVEDDDGDPSLIGTLIIMIFALVDNDDASLLYEYNDNVDFYYCYYCSGRLMLWFIENNIMIICFFFVDDAFLGENNGNDFSFCFNRWWWLCKIICRKCSSFFVPVNDDSRLGEINDNNDCLFRLVEDNRTRLGENNESNNSVLFI